MTQRTKPRRSHISGTSGIRNKARALARKREHRWFTGLLSGYTDDLKPNGPYQGVKLLKKDERHEANDDDATVEHAGIFAKGLTHEPLDKDGKGLPSHAEFEVFVATLNKINNEGRNDTKLADQINIERIDRLVNTAFADAKKRPLVNPLAAIGTSLDSVDTMDVAIPKAPALASRHAATELLELYWMSALRDVDFSAWGSDANVAKAAQELNEWNSLTHHEDGSWFAEHSTAKDGVPSWDSEITKQRLFRGSAPGVDEGDYLSVFLQAKIPFGTLDIEQTQYPLKEGNKNYLTDEADWHSVQEGAGRDVSRSDLEDQTPGNRKPIKTLRDLAQYVHFDALHEAYFNAALILDSVGAPTNVANIYNELGVVAGPNGMVDRKDIQTGFGTFGGPHIFVLLTEVATRALKAVWFQKWMVHRRLRPEVMGARLHCDKEWGTQFLHPDLGHTAGAVAGRASKDKWLLPMAYPEGSPMHPSYGAGHATVAGACVTILKAMFDTRTTCSELNFKGNLTGSTPSTSLEGELNKLGANIAIGRNGAGVHYRTDYTKSFALGEAVATALLQENAMTFADVNHERAFTFPTFDGHWVCIDAKGKLSRCAKPSQTSRFEKDGDPLQLRKRSLFVG